MKAILTLTAIFQLAAMATFLWFGMYGFAAGAGFFGAYVTWAVRRVAT